MTPIALFELLLTLTAAALVVSGLASRTALPPAAALVLGGMALALAPGVPAFQIDPAFILVLLLPPLLMASAYYTVWRDFRAEMLPILLLAVGAVAFTTACVGLAAHLVVPAMPLAACFTIGAIVSPPDAVAAKAVLQGLRVPHRLVTILEGESLVNDATGLVLYSGAVAAATTGALDVGHAAARFAWLAIGGIALGLAAGWSIAALLRKVRHADFAITFSLISSWSVYILADRLGVSGVLAVVAAGILFGVRQHEALGAGTRVAGAVVWQTVIYVLEALLFVLIGLALRGVLGQGGSRVLIEALPLVATTVGVVVVARLAWVLSVTALRRSFSGGPTATGAGSLLAASFVVGWAGMRGVVTLAVALALPEPFPFRDQILLAAFSVILFTIVVQGASLGPLIRSLRLPVVLGDDRWPMDGMAARAAVGRAALSAYEESLAAGDASDPRLAEAYRRRLEATTEFGTRHADLALARGGHLGAALAAVAASRAELIRLHRLHQIHDAVLRTIECEIDLEELHLGLIGRSAVS